MDGPLDHVRRTPLWRMLDGEQAAWRDLGDTVIADAVGDGRTVRSLAIADLSPLPRVGFKGRGTIEAPPGPEWAPLLAPQPCTAGQN